MRILIAALFVLPLTLPLTTPTAAGPDGAILVVSAADGPMPKASRSTRSTVRKAVRAALKKKKKPAKAKVSKNTAKGNPWGGRDRALITGKFWW